MQISTIQVLFFCRFSPRHLLRLLLNDCQSFWWGNLAQFQPFDPLQKRSQTFPCSREVGGDLVSLFIDVLFWNKKKMASEFRFIQVPIFMTYTLPPWNKNRKKKHLKMDAWEMDPASFLGPNRPICRWVFAVSQFQVGLATNPYLLPYPSTICLDSWRMFWSKRVKRRCLGVPKPVLVNLGGN